MWVLYIYHYGSETAISVVYNRSRPVSVLERILILKMRLAIDVLDEINYKRVTLHEIENLQNFLRRVLR